MSDQDTITPRELDAIRCYGMDLENGTRITRGEFPIFDRLLNTIDVKGAEIARLKNERKVWITRDGAFAVEHGEWLEDQEDVCRPIKDVQNFLKVVPTEPGEPRLRVRIDPTAPNPTADA